MAKKYQRRNCWTCEFNITTEIIHGSPVPCTPWCQPYQDEVIDGSRKVDPDGVLAWAQKVGLDEDNMPPRKTAPCPRWGKKRIK